MEAQFASLPTWLDVVSFPSQFSDSAGPDTPIFVDVGGGIGQQVFLICFSDYTKPH
jgi:hypothetical protein